MASAHAHQHDPVVLQAVPSPEGSIEQELAGILHAARLRGRQARAVAIRLGWDGNGSSTLAEAAAAEGYSRERVRQLEDRVRRHADAAGLPLPLTEAALRLVETAAPVSRDEIPGRLLSAGLASSRFDLEGILSAAELGQIEVRVVERDGIVTLNDEANLVETSATIARRLVKRHGACTVESLAGELGQGVTPETLRRLLESRSDVLWLDAYHEWFVIRGIPSVVLLPLRKMLAVSPTLTIAEIDGGLRRSFRPVTLPRDVLPRLCKAVSWLEFDQASGTVSSRVELDEAQVLSPLELLLARLFREHGPVLTFTEAARLGEREGQRPNSVGLYASRSPIFRTLRRGRYILRGTPITAVAEAASASRG